MASDAAMAETRAKAERYVADLLALPSRSPAFDRKADQLSSLGRREIAAFTDSAYRFLNRPGGGSATADVATAASRLRAIVEGLDPARHADGPRPRRFLGMVSGAPRIQDYFDRFTRAEQQMDAALRTLSAGRDALLQERIAIAGDVRRVGQQIGDLQAAITLAEMMTAMLETAARALDRSDPGRASALRDTALAHVQERIADMTRQMALTAQGVLALEIMRQNHDGVVAAIDGTVMATVETVRLAVAVARALSGYSLSLDTLTARAASTGGPDPLPAPGGSRIVPKAAAEPASLEALSRAFTDLYANIDRVDPSRRRM